MSDATTPNRNAIVMAAMALARDHDWNDVTLAAIAKGAGMGLDQLRNEIGGKRAILKAYVRHIDDAVLARAGVEVDATDTARDRVFDVLMMRFEAMAPHREAIRRIVRTAGPQPDLIEPFVASQRWMLAAAGLPSEGPEGTARALGLATAYADVFRVWLEDDDAGMSRTMARLDKRLRRGERIVKLAEDVRGTLRGFGSDDVLDSLFRLMGRRRKTSGDDAASPSTDDADLGGGTSNPPGGTAPGGPDFGGPADAGPTSVH